MTRGWPVRCAWLAAMLVFLAAAAPDAPLFFTIDPLVSAPAFDRERALAPDVLAPFEQRVDPNVRSAFDDGIKNLRAGVWVAAELAFKRAIAPDTDSTAPLAYLAATYAASGHDTEAASAWRIALANGSDLPQIFDWLGGALMRSRALPAARDVYDEAAGRWPDDRRFVIPLAVIDASTGSGLGAIARLETYLGSDRRDADALYLAIDWLHQAHAAGVTVHGAAADADLARAWADRYVKLNGTKAGVVKKWVDDITRSR